MACSEAAWAPVRDLDCHLADLRRRVPRQGSSPCQHPAPRRRPSLDQLKPTPDSPLDFTAGDKFFNFAERNNQRILGAHLVWDEGFGEGWTDDDLWGLNRKQAEKLLYGTVRSVVRHYKGRADAWIVCNEVTDPEGIRGVRTNVPWYNTIGKQYIAQSFRIAHRQDPRADLLLNEFGFETVNEYGDRPRGSPHGLPPR